MIRLMEWDDIPVMATVMKNRLGEHLPGLPSTAPITYYHRLSGQAYDSGCSVIVSDDNNMMTAGVAAVINPFYWNPELTELMVTIVHKFGASPFEVGKMLLRFKEISEYMILNKKVNRVSICANSHTNIDWSRLGFTPTETMYSMTEV